MANSYVTTCTEDENGDLVLDIPDELLDAMGWKEGTELSVEAFAGSIVLREVKAEGVGDS
jgi:antitoxin component of MazEF toxin-antitoxin module